MAKSQLLSLIVSFFVLGFFSLSPSLRLSLSLHTVSLSLSLSPISLSLPLSLPASLSLTYIHNSALPHHTDKLAVRSQKVAYFMLRKLGGGRAVKPGDRVALVFRPDEAAAFVAAFYGCLFAAVVPVCIEPPLSKEVCTCVCVCVCVCVHAHMPMCLHSLHE